MKLKILLFILASSTISFTMEEDKKLTRRHIGHVTKSVTFEFDEEEQGLCRESGSDSKLIELEKDKNKPGLFELCKILMLYRIGRNSSLSDLIYLDLSKCFAKDGWPFNAAIINALIGLREIAAGQELICEVAYNQKLKDSIVLLSLNLQDNKLKSLPHEIGDFTSLVRLDLTSNNLAVLPESIGKLTNLKVLLLKYNQLISLPHSIGNLTELTDLELRGTTNDYNKITEYPEEMSNLTNLQTLNINLDFLRKPISMGIVNLPRISPLTRQDLINANKKLLNK